MKKEKDLVYWALGIQHTRQAGMRGKVVERRPRTQLGMKELSVWVREEGGVRQEGCFQGRHERHSFLGGFEGTD